MNNWKASLDRYLTTEPDDGFGEWVELVTDNISPAIWEDYEAKFSDSDLESKWLNKLAEKGYDPQQAAKVMERGFCIFIKNRKRPELADLNKEFDNLYS